ncbi:Protein of unknown function [Gryllus bimaculatus]|nr:Protein of unknown function [Gryllus bimaculatus]
MFLWNLLPFEVGGPMCRQNTVSPSMGHPYKLFEILKWFLVSNAESWNMNKVQKHFILRELVELLEGLGHD